MANLLVKIVIFASLFVFAIFCAEFGDISVFAFFVFWSFIIAKEIFDYIYARKIALHRGFYKNESKIRKLLSGKILSAIFAFFSAVILAFSLILNLLSILPFEFAFVFTILPILFVLVRFFILKIFKNEVKNLHFATKKWVILISAFLGVLIFFILNLVFDFNANFTGEISQQTSLWSYLASQSVNAGFASRILNEIFVYSFYINEAQNYLQNAYFSDEKAFILLFISLNKFLFFVAILHFISYFFGTRQSEKLPKFGLFIATILTLAYFTLILNLAPKTQKNLQNFNSQETISAKTFEFILKNGVKFELESKKVSEFINEFNATKLSAKNITINALNAYIDSVFENGARLVAKKTADFNYSAMSDYLVLFHGVVDKNSTKFLNDKFTQFLNESFPRDFNENIEKLVISGISEYEKNLNSLLVKTSGNLSFDLNITNEFLLQNKLTRVQGSAMGAGFVGSAITLKIIAKSLAKTNAKLAASATTGSSGVVCGAGAIVCVPVLAVATWFGFDYIFAKGDEALNRADFERQIYNQILQSKDEFKNSLNNDINASFEQISDEIFQSIKAK